MDVEDQQQYRQNKNELLLDIDNKQYPNNFICLIQIHLENQQQQIWSYKSGGVIIKRQYILTAAHYLKRYQELKKWLIESGISFIDRSYIQISSSLQTQIQYSIQKIFISHKYNLQKNNMNDYAIIQIDSIQSPKFNQFQFPILLAVSEQFAAQIKQISVHGYTVKTNQVIFASNGQESCLFMKNQIKPTGPKRAEFSKLSYLVPVQLGISGGPVFTQFKQRKVVIGIHKQSNFSNKNIWKDEGQRQKYQYNFGVCASQMLEELNDWAQQFLRQPFVYTQKTLKVKSELDKICKIEILALSNDGDMKWIDNLSYRILIQYTIILSGNNIKQQGFQYLTRRKYHMIESLHLNKNSIKSLNNIPQENWINISTLKILSLSINGIDEFCLNISLLHNLQLLYLSYNLIKEISDDFIEFCRHRQNKLLIFLYKNKIKDEKHSTQQKKKQITKTNVKCIWTKQQKGQFMQ